jgi:hypothetical protein
MTPIAALRRSPRSFRVLVMLGVALADAASAHEPGGGDVVVTLDPVPARLARVRVQLQHTLAHQLLIENRTGTPLEVLDGDGVPFLRIGPSGAEANLAAAAWYRTVSPGDVPIPAQAHGSAPPAWTRVSTDPTWGWFDRRLRFDSVAVPHAIRNAGRPAELGRWTIPLRFGDGRVALRGRFRFEASPAGAFDSRLTSSPEPFPGVRVTLVSGRVPAVYLENTDHEPVVVLGAAGEPFLRIGPEGASANVRSPTWQQSGKAEVTTTMPSIDATAEPDWRTQSRTPRYAWIDFRAAPPDDPPRAVAGKRVTVRRWEVPLRRGTARAVVGGATDWVPVAAAPARPGS